MADDAAEQRQRVLAAALRQQLGAEGVAQLALEAAIGLEPLHRVGVQHLRPHVGVITGRVAAHDVAEVGRAVARRHRVVVVALLAQRLGLEGHHAVGRRDPVQRQLVPALVQARGAQVLGRGETLVELLGRQHLVQQRARHRLAGLVVLRVVRQHARPVRPHLVDLRRVLDEVARHLGAGHARVLHVGEHAVQRMPELVEQRRHLVPGQQRGLAVGRLRDVEVIRHHRLLVHQPALVDVGIHPGATALGGPRVQVGQEDRQLRAVRVEHVVDQHVGVVDRQVAAFLELEAVELPRRVEHAVLQHVPHLEVGLELRLVEAVLLGPQLLAVEAPVPGGQLERGLMARGLLAIDHGLQLGALAPGRADRRRRQLAQHAVDGLLGLGRLILEHEVGMRGEAQQPRPLGPQRDHARDQRGVVEGIAARAARHGGLVHALAQRAVLQLRQHRLAGRVQQRDQVLAVQAAGLGGRRGGGDLLLVQALEFLQAVDDDRRVVHFRQDVLVEARPQLRHLGVDRLHAGLAVLVQLRAGAQELLVLAFDQALLLRAQAQRGAALVQRLDAGEELGIQLDRVAVRGQAGGVVRLQLQPRGIGVGAGEAHQQRGRAAQRAAAAFERHDGVVEGRRGRVVGDRGHLGQLLRHALVERGADVGIGNAVERRVLQRQRTRRQQQVGGRRAGGGRRHGGGRGRGGRDGLRHDGRGEGHGGGQDEGNPHGRRPAWVTGIRVVRGRHLSR